MISFFAACGLYVDYMPFTYDFLKEVFAGNKDLIPMSKLKFY